MSVNGVTVRLRPYHQQPPDDLSAGYLSATDGRKGTTSRAWIDVDGRIVFLSRPGKQDRLEQGSVRLDLTDRELDELAPGLSRRHVTGRYVHINDIGSVEKEVWYLWETVEAKLIRFRQRLRYRLKLKPKPVQDYLFAFSHSPPNI
jgi:hypothetical protein